MGGVLNNKKRNAGNIFMAIFGAVAVVGVLGASIMTFTRGPIQSSVQISKRSQAETQMSIAGQSAIMAATSVTGGGDCDSDGMIEPLEWRDAGSSPKPLNGGLIPLSIGIAKKDPWGTDYGYCVWDHGPLLLDALCQGVAGTNKRLEGINAGTYPSVAIISAGPDKIFTTSCRNFSTGADRADQNNNGVLNDAGDLPLVGKAAATDDDMIFVRSYQQASALSGGLWTLKAGDPSKAVIAKNLEVAGNASFTGTGSFKRIGATGSDYLETLNGLKLASPSLMANCNPASLGALRLDAAAAGIEICNGTAWSSLSGGSAAAAGPTELKVFATSATYTGNLGGLSGADAKCQSLAAAASVSGTYKAWLSDGSASPDTRFTKGTVPYKMVDGTVVANNWTDLTDGTLAVAISKSETGADASGASNVWTATLPNGTGNTSKTCANWTDEGSVQGFTGSSNVANTNWTNQASVNCDLNRRLYCVQQIEAVSSGDVCDGSPAVGTVCKNGSVFAGTHLDGAPVYTSRCDLGQTWNGTVCAGTRQQFPFNNGNTTGGVFVGGTSGDNGQANTLKLIYADSDSATAGIQPHQAAQACADLVQDGRDDWYLPSQAEANAVQSSNAAIGNFDLSGAFYSTSTETHDAGTPLNHVRVRMSDGYNYADGDGKPYGAYIRCAAKGKATQPFQLAPNGTPAAPSYSFLSSPSSGLFMSNVSLKLQSETTLDITATTGVNFTGGSTNYRISSAGGIQIGEDTGTCGANLEGSVKFTAAINAYQYCNGTSWVGLNRKSPNNKWKFITTGVTHACGLTANGAAYCWGVDTNGRLGNGSAVTAAQPSPSNVSLAGPWTMISAGNTHSCGLTGDGTAYCWGSDVNGRLGNGATLTADQPDPSLVVSSLPWITIDVGNDQTCGIKSDGTAWCWGSDAAGQLGNGSPSTDQEEPSQVDSGGAVTGTDGWISISAGTSFSCGIKASGTAWCWGTDSQSQLGNGTSTAIKVEPSAVNDAGPWAAISAGYQFACGIKTNGSAWCWGIDSNLQLGNGTALTAAQASPSAVTTDPANILWTDIAAGAGTHACGVKADGSGWCWGNDSNGKLGNGDSVTASQPSPYQVSGSSKWLTIAPGGNNLTCGIKLDGTAWCWGDDTSGRLGNGPTVTAVQHEPSTVATP